MATRRKQAGETRSREGSKPAPKVTAPPPVRSRPARRAPKVAVFVAQGIVNEITTRRYPPGHRLPPEPQMQAMYGVARGTLREALRLLELNGVIKVRSGPAGGPMVLEPDAKSLASTLALLLQMHRAPIKQVIQARAVLEPMVAAVAADTMTDAQLESLGRWVEAMRDYIDDTEHFLESNFEFHRVIASASGNALFSDLVQAFDRILDGKFEFEYSPRARKAILQAHEAIYDALLQRDPDAAQAAMSKHLDDMQTYMQTRHGPQMENTVRWEDVKDY